jgi:hypothetical protein
MISLCFVSVGRMNAAQIWFLVGLVLVLAEFATPGVILVFIGLGAWVAALTTWLGWTEALGAQMGVFAVSSTLLADRTQALLQELVCGFLEVERESVMRTWMNSSGSQCVCSLASLLEAQDVWNSKARDGLPRALMHLNRENLPSSPLWKVSASR